MGDVKIVIKDGSIVGVDSEEGDDNDVDGFSGSGDRDVDHSTSTTEIPVFTPTSNKNLDKSSSPPETDILPYIIAGVAAVVLLVIVITIILCCRSRRRAKSKKSPTRAVVYSPNDRETGRGACGEGYSVAIPLEGGPPLEEAPPPPLPASAPPMAPHLSGSTSSKTRYTPLGGRRVMGAAGGESEDEKNSIYESIEDDDVANVYEEAKPLPPQSHNSGSGRQRILSSVTEDPNMGSETDKMLPSNNK